MMASQTRHFEFEAAILDPKTCSHAVDNDDIEKYINLFYETDLIKVSTKKQRIYFFLQTKSKKLKKKRLKNDRN